MEDMNKNEVLEEEVVENVDADDTSYDEVVEDDEIVIEEDEETTAEVKAPKNIFKKIIAISGAGLAALAGFFMRLFGRGKKAKTEADTTVDGDNTEAPDPKTGFWAKVKAFFTMKDPSAGESAIRESGMTGLLAVRCSKFIAKIIKKISKKAGEDTEAKCASVLQVIFKVICVVAAAAFAGLALVWFVKLLPVILVAVAKMMAVALIVELIFFVLGFATNTTTKCCE